MADDDAPRPLGDRTMQLDAVAGDLELSEYVGAQDVEDSTEEGIDEQPGAEPAEAERAPVPSAPPRLPPPLPPKKRSPLLYVAFVAVVLVMAGLGLGVGWMIMGSEITTAAAPTTTVAPAAPAPVPPATAAPATAAPAPPEPAPTVPAPTAPSGVRLDEVMIGAPEAPAPPPE
ncbi:MAG: hypothetical protein IT378_15325 [Sandaracinaceae bacterium]|nr:hypothetical protein [Sandaracinaceae bacterium]